MELQLPKSEEDEREVDRERERERERDLDSKIASEEDEAARGVDSRAEGK